MEFVLKHDTMFVLTNNRSDKDNSSHILPDRMLRRDRTRQRAPQRKAGRQKRAPVRGKVGQILSYESSSNRETRRNLSGSFGSSPAIESTAKAAVGTTAMLSKSACRGRQVLGGNYWPMPIGRDGHEHQRDQQGVEIKVHQFASACKTFKTLSMASSRLISPAR